MARKIAMETRVAALIDRLSDVLSATRRLYEACLRLEQLDRTDLLPKGARRCYWGPLRSMGDPDLEERLAAEDKALLAKLERSVEAEPWGGAVAMAVRSTRDLRDRIDKARAVLPDLVEVMNDSRKAGPDRWTAKTDGELRRLRGAIVLRQPRDFDPSDMPWVGVGVPEALQEATRPIVARMEELKSVGFVGAPSPEPAEADDLRPSAWFSKATSAAFYPDLLRVAVHDGRLKGSTRHGKRWQHSINAVCMLYPQYRSTITKAKEDEGNVSKPKG